MSRDLIVSGAIGIGVAVAAALILRLLAPLVL